jgi:UDP-N-acetylmuramoyl-L-alanyl-D-glutamate--2,6-diaminopimelate ligase
MPGTRVHGNAFAAQAVQRGAVAVVTDTKTDVPSWTFRWSSCAMCAPPLHAPPRVSSRQQPSVSVAVTGTNGKSSIVSFVRQIWQASGIPAASLGTVGVETAEGLEPRELTTSDALSLHRDLGTLKARGHRSRCARGLEPGPGPAPR